VDNAGLVKGVLSNAAVIITAKQDALALDNDNLTAYMMEHGENMTTFYHHSLYMMSQNTNFVQEREQRFEEIF
jgi:hypothetical protein